MIILFDFFGLGMFTIRGALGQLVNALTVLVLLEELAQRIELLVLLLGHLVQDDEATDEQQAEDERRRHALERVPKRVVRVEAARHGGEQDRAG